MLSICRPLLVLLACGLLTSTSSYPAKRETRLRSISLARHYKRHSVTLTWTASISPGVAGYRVYRGAGAGGPYLLLDTNLVAGTTYTDSNLSSGGTYYYVATAVDTNNNESEYSNEAGAQVP